jgi:branched-chain amino acid transport system substrate-binding protein
MRASIKGVLIIASVSIVMVLSLYGCEKKHDTVRIGIAGPMTGSDAKMGADFRNGVNIAVDEWNEKGGVLGKKVELVFGDDGSDPKQAVAIANKLVNEGVVGVVGHYNSSCSIPASDVYHRAGIPMITPASTNPTLTTRGYNSIFRVCGTDDQQGKVSAEFVKSRLKIKKVAIVHDKTTYGQGLADFFRKYLTDGTEVVFYGGITRGDKDFKAVLTTIKDKNPEILFFGGIYPEGGLLVKQAREINLKAPFMSGDAVIDHKFIEIAGLEAAEGTYLTFSPDIRNVPEAKPFIEKYTAKYGEIGPYSIYAYTAVNVILEAVKTSGIIDGKAIIEALHKSEFASALGRMKFTEKGDIAHITYVVWITRNGKFQEYWKP